jgi:hypothetical protein
VSTIVRGNAAEAAVLHAFVAAGIHVLVPFGDGLHFDLAAVITDHRILRVQVKSGRVRKGCVEFNTCSTDHGRGHQHYRGRADIIAVHVASTDLVYIVPVDDCPSFRGYLRLDAPRNNQRLRVRLARDYTLEAWVQGLGAA